MFERDNFVYFEKEYVKCIQEECWEYYKDVIVVKYKELMFDKIKMYMEKEYNFKVLWVIFVFV